MSFATARLIWIAAVGRIMQVAVLSLAPTNITRKRHRALTRKVAGMEACYNSIIVMQRRRGTKVSRDKEDH
jgi:hypothetical protein